MAKIRVLTDETINKIAAGEVVENPASVVKELVENAIDAGACHLTIEIKGGGFQQILVSDDGTGMSGDDALLCFERHATSKIAGIEDLSSLHSMGFRGEALASIGAVARIDLTTATDDGSGIHLEISGGKMGVLSPASRRRGTTFAVKSLFFNVPARKKFQKQAAASTAEIHRLVLSLALAHPEVGFELMSNEEVVLQVPYVENAPLMEVLEKRIADLFRGSFLKENIFLRGEERGYRLQGFLGMSGDHRVNRTGQHLFINRRPIFSPQVSRAVKEGYGERLGVDRYPVFVLHMEVPAASVDVNVHPQKKEVRFEEGDFVRQFVRRLVQKAFAPVAVQKWIPSPPESFISEEFPLRLREEPPSTPGLFHTEVGVVGVFEQYLLLEGSTVEGYQEGVVWVDLQQAQQQIIWSQLNNAPLAGLAQGLLFPLALELSPVEARSLEGRQVDLARCGFALQASGKQSILVEAIPPFLEEADVSDTLRLILESEDSFSVLSEKVARFAVRRKKKFTAQEALALWNRFKLLNSREGMVGMGKHEIEKLFKAYSKAAAVL